MFGLLAAWRRRRLAREPVPAAWLTILEDRVPFFRRLDPADRARLATLATVFVRDKHWEGAGGLQLDDEIRLVIAAAAARLVLHRDLADYDALDSIVVYPGAYRHPEREGAILGEARHLGTVVLSWDAVQRGLGNPDDGHDTASHEFAHVLDHADGAFDGTPVLDRPRHYGPWARIMAGHFGRLRRGHRDLRRVLRAYGATDEAEFFAVATESFFEKPRQLRARAPELYAQLQRFYRTDPAAAREAAPG